MQRDGKLNQYTVLPPITPQGGIDGNDMYGGQSIDHLVTAPPSKVSAENYGLKNVPLNLDEPAPPLPMHQMQQLKTNRDDNFLPRQPVQWNDVMRDLKNYSSEQLKSFYSELTSYDPNLSGSVHHMYVSLVAMRNKVREKYHFLIK